MNNQLLVLSAIYIAILLQVLPQIVLSVVFCYAVIQVLNNQID